MIKEKLLPGAEELADWQRLMEQMGPRLTGTRAHEEFIRFIAGKLEELNLEVKEDVYPFRMWEAETASLTMEGTDTSIPVASVFPYSGETPSEGITAEVVFCKANRFAKARGKIACVEVHVPPVPSLLAFKPRSCYPRQTVLRKTYRSPLVASFLKAPNLQKAKAAGVLGVICIWRQTSPAGARGQHLPFTTPYQGLPAIWVEGAFGDKLRQAEAAGAKVQLQLSARTTEQAVTRTVYTVLPGENSHETILLNTHTDGPNEVEENGPFALLSLLRYFRQANLKPARTLICIFATGHFQLPQLGVEGKQATSRWLRDHPEWWDGKDGHAKAVAGVTVEHLGCMEWQDNPAKTAFRPTGRREPELVYTANESLSRLYLKAAAGRPDAVGFTLRPRNGIYLGEGQPLYQAGIPTVSFIPIPDYLCRLQDDSEPGVKIDSKLMHEQIRMLLELVLLLDRQSTADIGPLQRTSYGLLP